MEPSLPAPIFFFKSLLIPRLNGLDWLEIDGNPQQVTPHTTHILQYDGKIKHEF